MTPGKDVECVLVFDPSTSSFKLMPLNYVLRVNPSREKPGKVKEAISRNPSPVVVNPSRSTPTPTAASALKGVASPKVTPVSSPLINTLPQSPNVKPTNNNAARTQAGISKAPRATKSAAKSGPTSTMKKVTRTAKNASAKVAAGRRAAPAAIPPTNTTPPTVNSASKASPAPQVPPRRTAAKSLPTAASPATSPTKPATSTKSAPKKKILSEEIVHPEDDEDIEMKEVDDGSDDDLLGALANELEESLEDDSNHSNTSGENNRNYDSANGQGNGHGFSVANDSSSSDEDEQFTNRVNIIDRSSSSATHGAFNSPNSSHSGGPMSLRGFLSHGRPEEEELSSSEEE